MNRCPWAIKAGVTLTTRCTLTEGHAEAVPREPQHVGRGLPAFPYQRIMWLPCAAVLAIIDGGSDDA